MDKWFDTKFEKNKENKGEPVDWTPYESEEEDPFCEDNLHSSYDFRPNRNSKKLIILVVVIILLCLVLAYDFGGAKTFIEEKVDENRIISAGSLSNPSNSSPKKTNELSKCERKYKEALNIRERKYNLDSKFLESEKVDNYEEASLFLNTWKTQNLGGLLDDSEKKLLEVKDYPIVMLASSIEQDFSLYASGGFYMTSVSYCNKDGKFFMLKK